MMAKNTKLEMKNCSIRVEIASKHVETNNYMKKTRKKPKKQLSCFYFVMIIDNYFVDISGKWRDRGDIRGRRGKNVNYKAASFFRTQSWQTP
jgi:DNA-directed RNA polymerase delta subunit